MCREYIKAIEVKKPVILERAIMGVPGKFGNDVIALHYRFQTGAQGETWTVDKQSLRRSIRELKEELKHRFDCGDCAKRYGLSMYIKFVVDPFNDELVDVVEVKKTLRREAEDLYF